MLVVLVVGCVGCVGCVVKKKILPFSQCLQTWDEMETFLIGKGVPADIAPGVVNGLRTDFYTVDLLLKATGDDLEGVPKGVRVALRSLKDDRGLKLLVLVLLLLLLLLLLKVIRTQIYYRSF